MENHVNETEEDADNLLYYDDEGSFNADILDRPDLFYGHPEDMLNGSNDGDYPYSTWEGGMDPRYEGVLNAVEDPYERPRTAHGRPDGGMFYGGMMGPASEVYDYDDEDDLGYDDRDLDGMYGMRPETRGGAQYGYDRYWCC